MVSELVESLLRSVRGSDVSEIEYEADGVRLRIVRGNGQGAGKRDLAGGASTPPASSAAQRDAVGTAGSRSPAARVICAPMHGTFYRSTAPGEPPIAHEGQMVEEGQQLALLEAMKMLHAVEAECAGRIAKILVENGVAVEPGTPLFEIEPR